MPKGNEVAWLKGVAAAAILAAAAALAFVLTAQAAGIRPCAAPGVHAAGDLRSASGAVVGIVYVNGELSCPPQNAAQSVTFEVQLQQASSVAAVHVHRRGSDGLLVDLTSAGVWTEPNRVLRAFLGHGLTPSITELRQEICANQTYLDVHIGTGTGSAAVWRAELERGTKC